MRWCSKSLGLIFVLGLSQASAQTLGPPNAVTSVPASALPALTGDCTTTAGTAATTCLKTNGTAFTPIATSAVGQLPGIATNTAASSGNIGEVIESSVPAGSAVSLTGGVQTNITSISLTPGRWLCQANLATIAAGTTITSFINGAISSVSATMPTVPNRGAFLSLVYTTAAGASITSPVGTLFISIPTTQSLYLVTQIGFSVSTLSAYGYLGCTRTS